MASATTASLTPRHAWRRFLRHRAACIGLVLLALLAAISLLTLPVTWSWHDVQALTSAIRHPPALSPAVDRETYLNAGDGHQGWERDILYHTVSWLGHDDLGRSLLMRLMPAFLVSLGIGLGAAIMALIIGTAWGATAGLIGGRVDAALMRIVDVLFGLPYILMVILLKVALTRPLTALLGESATLANLVILLAAIGGVSWLTLARVVRGQVLALRELTFVEAARAAGAGPLYIFRRHILPHLLGPIVVYTALVVPQAILQESFLSFLGIGVQQPTPSLGRLAADGVEAVNTFVDFWWLLVYPCATLVITLLALNFISDGLRDALDPRSREATLV
ncbi:MAG: ABC transporter permease [Phycisphaerae bacterium]|nr:ABC transporter permease [Phycisphaerae bacterium]